MHFFPKKISENLFFLESRFLSKIFKLDYFIKTKKEKTLYINKVICHDIQQPIRSRMLAQFL